MPTSTASSCHLSQETHFTGRFHIGLHAHTQLLCLNQAWVGAGSSTVITHPHNPQATTVTEFNTDILTKCVCAYCTLSRLKRSRVPTSMCTLRQRMWADWSWCDTWCWCWCCVMPGAVVPSLGCPRLSLRLRSRLRTYSHLPCLVRSKPKSPWYGPFKFKLANFDVVRLICERDRTRATTSF